jgi:hypothetical protein
MSIWGFVLFVLVSCFMPTNEELWELTDLPQPSIDPAQEPSDAGGGDLYLKAAMASGSFLRIFQRVMWETGAFVVFTELFGW